MDFVIAVVLRIFCVYEKYSFFMLNKQGMNEKVSHGHRDYKADAMPHYLRPSGENVSSVEAGR